MKHHFHVNPITLRLHRPHPRFVEPEPLVLDSAGLRIFSGASTADHGQVEQVEVEVVVPSESDDDGPDILREPSKHLPGRREEECLVGGRSTTEKSAFVISGRLGLENGYLWLFHRDM